MSRAEGQVRVGIAGTGWVARHRYLPALRRDRRAQVTALYTPIITAAQEAAKRFGVPRAFSDLALFLREPIDVVVVCSPPQTHFFLVQEALKAGKHVLVEKPMTLTSREGQLLEALARERGLVLCPAHNFLFSSSLLQARALLEGGKLGEVDWAFGVQVSSWRRRLPVWFQGLPGGLFFDEAPHFLYLMQYFLGSLQVEEAWRSHSGPAHTERMEVRLRGERGTGYLSMWLGAPLSEWLLVVAFTRGVLVIDLFRDILVHLPPEQDHKPLDVVKVALRGTLQLWRGIGASGVRLGLGRLLFGHDRLVQGFLDAVCSGRPSPVPPRQGWEVIALMEEIIRRTPWP